MVMTQLQVGSGQLVAWCRRVLRHYHHFCVADVTDGTANVQGIVWSDGLAFCALIHRYRPHLFDFDSLLPTDAASNCLLAFKYAEHHLGVLPLLIPSDVSESPPPDPLLLLCYISQLYLAVNKQTGVGGKELLTSSIDEVRSLTGSPTAETRRKITGTRSVDSSVCDDNSISSTPECASLERSVTSAEHRGQDRKSHSSEHSTDSCLGGGVTGDCQTILSATQPDDTVCNYHDIPQKEDGRGVACSLCGETVRFVAQRLLIDYQLYHRQCFKCVACASFLSTANFHAEDSGFCCDMCPCEITKFCDTDCVDSAETPAVPPEINPVNDSSCTDQLAPCEGSIIVGAPSVADTPNCDNQQSCQVVSEHRRVVGNTEETTMKSSAVCAETGTSPLPSHSAVPEVDGGVCDQKSTASIAQASDECDADSSIVDNLRSSGTEAATTDLVRDESDTRDASDSRDASDARDASDSRDASDARDASGSRDASDARDVSDTCDASDTRDASDSRDASDTGGGVKSEECAARDGVGSAECGARGVVESGECGARDGVESGECGARDSVESGECGTRGEVESGECVGLESSVPATAAVADQSNPFDENDSDVEYPDQLNPFGSEDDEEKGGGTGKCGSHTQQQSAVSTCAASQNPFGEEDEEFGGKDAITHPEITVIAPDAPKDTPPPKPPRSPAPINPFEPPPRPPPPVIGVGLVAPPSSLVTGISPSAGRRTNRGSRTGSPRSGFSEIQRNSSVITGSARFRTKRAAPKPPTDATSVVSTESETSGSCSVEPSYSAPSPSPREQSRRVKGPAPSLPVPDKRQVNTTPLKQLEAMLETVVSRQLTLEQEGVQLEHSIRQLQQLPTPDVDGGSGGSGGGYTDDLENMTTHLFGLMVERNLLLRRQTQLVYMQNQICLERQHAELEHSIRQLMAKSVAVKTDDERLREQTLIDRLVKIVEKRDRVATFLEDEHLRESGSVFGASETITDEDDAGSEHSTPGSAQKKDKKKVKIFSHSSRKHLVRMMKHSKSSRDDERTKADTEKVQSQSNSPDEKIHSKNKTKIKRKPSLKLKKLFS